MNNNKIINIFSFTDFHGVIDNVRPYDNENNDICKNAGLSMFSKLMEIKEEYRCNSLVVSAGDTFGNPSLETKPGSITIPLMNLIEVSAMTIGNHEFDWIPLNPNFFNDLKNEIKFPLLSCNLYGKKKQSRPSFLKPSIIYTIQDIKIGFVGMTTAESNILCLEEELGEYEVREPIVYLKKELKELKKNGVDLIFLIVHSGLIRNKNTNNFEGEIVEILNCFENNEINGAILGHTHEIFSGEINKIPIVQAGAYGNAIGHIKITIDSKLKKILSLETQIIKIENEINLDYVHPKVKKIMDENYRLNEIEIKEIGYSNRKLSIKNNEESYWGKYVAKAIGEEVKAEISMINTGSFRTEIDPGKITDFEIMKNLPFNNTIVLMNLRGNEIKKILERSIQKSKGMLQTYGILYELSYENMNSIKLKNGEHLDLEKEYLVATTNYLALGGDFFSEFKNASKIIHSEVIVRDAVIKKISKDKSI